MMPIQRGQLTELMRRAFGLRGATELNIDEVFVPVVQMLDVEDTPYGGLSKPCGASRGNAAAGAGVFSFIGVQPVANVAHLLVKQVVFSNVTAGNLEYEVVLVAPGQAFNVAARTLPEKLLDHSGQGLWNGTTPPRVASDVMAGAANPTVGTRVHRTGVLPFTAEVLTFAPGGITLRCDDPAGVPALAVRCTTANNDVIATFICEEWPL